uniref:3-beta hydroxysteroid dehydrogenase/isomerase domain-containing protein n=1 Tax=Quercus lobata TaxID=97700 RepID=A0A7N2LCR8_QUELO
MIQRKQTAYLCLMEQRRDLKLFKANLLEEGSFDSVVDECVGVFHTASPVFLAASDPQAELIDPAVKGTLNVLKSCSKFSSIKRVIVTSSIAAIIDVANAHIQAFETPSASGRYCLVGRVTPHSEILKILGELFPALFPTQKPEDDKPPVPTFKVSQEKARSLGINFIPLEVSLKDLIESLEEKGLLSF